MKDVLGGARWGTFGAVALAALVFPDLAYAQTPAAPAAANVADSNDIIVTARRREERLQDVPVAITALSARTIERAAAADVMAIAQMVPSMVVGRQLGGSGASIFLRGVGSSPLSSGFDQSVSTVLDGLPMSRGREVVFSQFDLRQVEVLKGPQALFFGKNSTGGIINITTADPTDKFEASVKTGYEFKAREFYGEAMTSGPLSETLKARIAVRGSTQDGAFKNSGGPAVDAYGFAREPNSSRRGANKSIAGRATLLWNPTETMDWRLKAGGTIYKEPNGNDLYERKCGQGRTAPLATTGIADPFADCKINGVSDHSNIPQQIAGTTPYFKSHPYTDNKSYYANLTGNLDLGGVTLTSITGYYHFRQQDVGDYNGSTAGNYVGQLTRFRQLSEELRAATDFDGPFNVTVGGFYAKSKFFFGADNVGTPYPVDALGRYYAFLRDGGFDGKSYSAFVSARFAITPQLELAGGARYSHDAKDSFVRARPANSTAAATFPPTKFLTDNFKDHNLSPEATLTWKPNEDVTLYGAYKRGYKAGGFNTSFTLTAAAKTADGQFGSETAQGGEVGLRTRLLDRSLSINITAYHYKYKDLQAQIYDPITISSKVTNAGSLITKGIEGEFIWNVPQAGGLEFHGSWAYNSAKFGEYVGLCYTGQTISQGCNLVPNATGTAFTSQDYGGRQAPKAPKFAARLGSSLPVKVGGGWVATLSADMSYSSRYGYTDTLRPDGYQASFVRWDAGLRLGNEASGWEFALFGRNLTNKYVVTSANDFSFGAGVGGTGTAVGKAADLNAIVDRPRQIYVQVTKRF